MSPKVHAVLLAAGRSSRSGPAHKLLARFDGVPLVRCSAETALASRASGVTVVLGYRAADLRAVLQGLSVDVVENPRFAEGLSTSLICGFRAVPPDAEGILVMLADQPLLIASDLNRLIDAFAPDGEGALVIATDNGRRFNPVVISCRYRDEIERLSGDVGAKSLMLRHVVLVREVEIGSAASCDVDTAEAIIAAGGEPER